MKFESPENYESQQEKEAEQKSEMVIVLGASLRDTAHGDYEHFPLHVTGNPKANLRKDGEPVEVVGGDARLRAVTEYVHSFKEAHPDKEINIFTSGGVEESGTSRAVAARDKLLAKHHLEKDIVHALPSTGSTLGNARALAAWAHDHFEEIGKLREIKILTNAFHSLRAWAMFTHALHTEYRNEDLAQKLSEEDKKRIATTLKETVDDYEHGDRTALEEIQRVYTSYIKDDPVHVKVLVAEDLLGAADDEAKQRYARLLRSDALVQEARKNERKGINDLLAGKYRVR